MAEGRRLPIAALTFALAAALSSWNPLAAPFGLVVGLGAAVLSVRALTGNGRRLLSGVALVLALGAAVASALVLALTAGVARDEGAVVVPVPAAGEVERDLDAAAERTRAARERAEAERRRLVEGR
jgi:hypothetical protein